MIVIGVAGKNAQVRDRVALALTRGRLALEWAFASKDEAAVCDRLVNCLPTNLVVFSDVVEPWQAALVRRAGGLVLHVVDQPGGESSVPVDGSDQEVCYPEFMPYGAGDQRINDAFAGWESLCESFQQEMLSEPVSA